MQALRKFKLPPLPLPGFSHINEKTYREEIESRQIVGKIELFE